MNLLIIQKILTKYIVTKFVKYFLVITLLLALICNLVDFLEKFSRNFGSLKTIIGFILLNFIPSFIDLMPIGSYLASVLLIRELEQKGEWEYCTLIGINRKKFINLAIIIGSIISLSTFVSKEFLFIKVEKYAQVFKEENLKSKVKNSITNKWFLIDNSLFTHINSINTKTLEGEGLSIYVFDSDFSLKEKRDYKRFVIDLKNKSINGDNEEICISIENEDKKIIEQKIINYFKDLNKHSKNIIKNFSENIKKDLKKDTIAKNELCNLSNRFCFYLNPFIYLIFTFTLFFMFYSISKSKMWLIIFSIYPIMTLISNFCFFISKKLLLPFLIIYFYGAIIFIGYLFMHYLKRH